MIPGFTEKILSILFLYYFKKRLYPGTGYYIIRVSKELVFPGDSWKEGRYNMSKELTAVIGNKEYARVMYNHWAVMYDKDTREFKQAVSCNGKYIINPAGTDFEITTLENYNARIMDARKVNLFRRSQGFEKAIDCIDYWNVMELLDAKRQERKVK